MINRLIIGFVAMLMLAASGCKSRTESSDSALRDATAGATPTPAPTPAAPGPKCSPQEQIDAVTVAGVGYVGTACGGSVCGGPSDKLSFRKMDRMPGEACPTVASSLPLKTFGPFEITLPSGVKIPLATNDTA